MYVTSTDFRQNIGKYLELCEGEDVYIMKHGNVYAKLSGITVGKTESAKRICGSLNLDTGYVTEKGSEEI
jgi:antitoxin (DNA-binding transcriptional repressor) of toxin-antitoxin stability system